MIELEREKAEAILGYLMGRPFAEVEAPVTWLRLAIAAAEADKPNPTQLDAGR
jgi:hypothetical protein